MSINSESIGKSEELDTPKFEEVGAGSFSKVTNQALLFESATLGKIANQLLMNETVFWR